jgi:hypothetical protein
MGISREGNQAAIKREKVPSYETRRFHENHTLGHCRIDLRAYLRPKNPDKGLA